MDIVMEQEESAHNGGVTVQGPSGDPTLSHVRKATYPIPQPLARILKSAILHKPGQKTEQEPSFMVESMEDALAQLVGNSIEAMDAMYFATPAHVRNHESFAHRLCLRVEVCAQAQTLTITDLGSGMTRADLINALGIGHLSHGALSASRKLSQRLESREEPTNTNVYDTNNDEESTSSSSSSSMSSSSDNENESLTQDSHEEERKEETEKQATNNHKRHHHHGLSIPCKASDIGGFYSALVALGVGVNVGTKSKFDDYYEFEVGKPVHQNGNSIKDDSCFDAFRIVRPMNEGVRPTVDSGYNKFSDVRGDCGTRVTIRLNDKAIAAKWLDEEGTLKPILQHILETTQYSVAFSSNRQEAQEIIDASAKEDQENEKRNQDNSSTKDSGGDAAILLDATSLNNNASPMHGYNHVGSHNTVKERAKYIPIRLSLGERKMLRLVEASMACCEYTTLVDKPFKSGARRTHQQLKGITAVLRGLVTACDYASGQKLYKDDNFIEYDVFFRQMFEIARRHKIMNPEKMRTEYGKLVYLLQDTVSPSVQPHLGFTVKGKIETVYKFLEEREGLKILDDKLIEIATEEILAEKKTRAKINSEIRRKEKAVAALKQKYHSAELSAEDIHLCLYSICDNNSFLNSNRVPIDKVIDYLVKFFPPEKIEEGYSLSIVSGKDGARLSHSHERQYTFALQSLTLWRDIIDDMFRLWHMAEEDLLSETVTYELKDTGQGMQRVQQSPRTYKAMQQILARVQDKVKHWVGSSVIHLGDHNVPNALSFIDKYTQVPRILGPLVSCLENLERICEKDDKIKEMVETGFGGMEKLRKDILYDFFRSAFDGSGADNFYDAGSCIDGRLTSAWNWCSQLPTKPFYPIFKLTGFTGFDGEFK